MKNCSGSARWKRISMTRSITPGKAGAWIPNSG
jgi:hypothetical protein